MKIIYFDILKILCVVLLCVCDSSSSLLQSIPKNTQPKVCIIGAGISGLTSAKHLKQAGINFTILESSKYIGGTWRYDEQVGVDADGLPIHTSMYKNLRTNLPKQTMELSDFPVPENMRSFPYWDSFYDYLKSYVEHFGLEQHIQFSHQVLSVRKVEEGWRVVHKHINTGDLHEEYYDYVYVCVGHHSKPKLPKLPGEDKFQGSIIHSHDYRTPEPYSNSSVLIIGAGPSGMDIALEIARFNTKVYHSQHTRINFTTPFPENYVKKPDVQEFTENGVKFVDGSFAEVDHVVYCTGYEFSYPFFDDNSTGLLITSQFVNPLYRYMVNINEPTLFFIGIVYRACMVIVSDVQARYAAALVQGNFTLPSKNFMMLEWQERMDRINLRNKRKSDIHALAEKEDQYYADLSSEAGIPRVLPVMHKIRQDDLVSIQRNLYTYRDYVYTIIDNSTFVKRHETAEELRTIRRLDVQGL